MAAKKNKYAFTPYKANAKPPQNLYDVSLDAQERAGQRGLIDLTQDTQRANQRGLADYMLARNQVGTQRARTKEDYNTGIGNLTRSYLQRGLQQGFQATQAGVAGNSGALAQAMLKRKENFAMDRKPMDTNFARAEQDTNTRLGAMALDYQRSYADRNTVQLPRAQREQKFFETDVAAQRFQQAKTQGWNPAKKDPNEFTQGKTVYRRSGKGDKAIYTLPTGKRYRRPQFLQYLRSHR